MTFTLRTALLRGLDIITVDVEFVANRDELFINCVTPLSVTGADEMEIRCRSGAELIVTTEEDAQLMEEGHAQFAEECRFTRDQREIERDQNADYERWRKS